MAISFGKAGLNKPTPSGTSMIIDIITGVGGVVIAWLLTADFIPNTVSNVIGSVLGLIIGIAQVLKPFFGVKTTAGSVPIDQVSSMDEPPLPYHSPNDAERNNK